MKLCQLAPRIAARLEAFHDLGQKCFNISSGRQNTDSLRRDKHPRDVEIGKRCVRVECLELLSIIGECLDDRFSLSCHTHHVLLLKFTSCSAAGRRASYALAV